MKIENTEPRLFVCNFIHPHSEQPSGNEKIISLRFAPGITEVPAEYEKSFLAHPSVKSRLDLGKLVVVSKAKAAKTKAEMDAELKKLAEDKKKEDEAAAAATANNK